MPAVSDAVKAATGGSPKSTTVVYIILRHFALPPVRNVQFIPSGEVIILLVVLRATNNLTEADHAIVL